MELLERFAKSDWGLAAIAGLIGMAIGMLLWRWLLLKFPEPERCSEQREKLADKPSHDHSNDRAGRNHYYLPCWSLMPLGGVIGVLITRLLDWCCGKYF